MARLNSYGEETVIVPTRVPVSKVFDFRGKASRILNTYKIDKSPEPIKPNAVLNKCDCYIENGLMKRGKSGCKTPKTLHNWS